MADSTIPTGLPQLCEEAVAFGLRLRRARDPGDAEQLRQNVAGLLNKLEMEAAEAGHSAGDVLLAKYAIVAYIDEIVLSSHWEIRNIWAGKPLQLEYFNDFTAGEEFYNKIDGLRNKGGTALQVLEVYALCLGLGFKGKNADMAGMERLKVLMGDLNKEILGGKAVGALSPHWETDEQEHEQVRNLPVWILLSVGAAVLLLLFFLFDYLLGAEIANLAATEK